MKSTVLTFQEDELDSLMRTDLRGLVAHSESVHAGLSLGKLTERLRDATVSYFAVLDDDRVAGVISTESVGRLFGGRYGFALHSERTVVSAMEPECLVVRCSTGLLEVLSSALNREGPAFLTDVVLLDDSGAFVGMIPIFRLARLQSRLLQIQCARAVADSEKELVEQKALLQSVLSSMGDGVVVADARGRIHMFNPAAERILRTRLSGPSADDFRRRIRIVNPETGKPLHPKDTPLVRAARGEAVEATEIFLCSARTDFGIWLSVNAMPLRSRPGGAGWCVLVFRDITDQKQAEDGLRSAKTLAEQANRAKSAFLANMSHELRTPLNAILGYSEMLMEDMSPSDPDCMSDLGKIHASGKYLLSLINDLLDLSKIEAGRMEAVVEQFDLRQLLDDVVTTIKPTAMRRSNRIELVVPETMQVNSDHAKLRQVLLNLLSNACKFTESGTITITTDIKLKDSGRELEVRIQDTGIGIDSGKLQTVFEPFVQADSSTARLYGGTGLGLAISRRFCRLLGGELSVTSEPGQGSTFTVRLPAAAAAAIRESETNEVPTTIDEAAPASEPGKDAVVVIDDDPDASNLLSRLLVKMGLRPIPCRNAQEGIRTARQCRPRAITLDVQMSEPDGWTTLQRIKEDPDLRDIPIVMVTVVDEPRKSLSLGAFAHLTKPLNNEAFQETIRRCLDKDSEPAPLANLPEDCIRA